MILSDQNRTIPAMILTIEEMISFFQKWQTLIGAFIGGILGLLAALIVARDARRREERAAAMLLITDLHNIKIASEILNEIIKRKEPLGEEKARFIADMLSKDTGGLSLSPLFDSSMARVVSLDYYLGAHLGLFRRIFTRLDAALAEIRRNFEIYKLTGKVSISRQELDSKVEAINRQFNFAVEHAICAEHLLDKLILRWTAPFHRVARKIPLLKRLAMKSEKPCINFLEKADSPVAPNPPGPS